MTESSEEIEEMTRQYEINQMRIIEEGRRKGRVETKYETIQLPKEKQEDPFIKSHAKNTEIITEKWWK